MRKFSVLTLFLFLAFSSATMAQTELFYTNFSEAPGTWTTDGDLTNTLAANGDFETWMLATTYCGFSNTGSITLPSITFGTGMRIVVKWGIHDSGRTVELMADGNSVTTFNATPDQMTESIFDFDASYTGAKVLSLNINEGVVVVTEVTVSSGNTPAKDKNISATSSSVVGVKGSLKICNASGEKVEIIDILGNLLYSGDVVDNVYSVPVKAGIYVVRVAGIAHKVCVQ